VAEEHGLDVVQTKTAEKKQSPAKHQLPTRGVYYLIRDPRRMSHIHSMWDPKTKVTKWVGGRAEDRGWTPAVDPPP
jgi:hypothetical protein